MSELLDALGDGVINLPEIIGALQDAGFDGDTTLEVAGAENVKRSVERLKAWTRQSARGAEASQ